MTGSHQEPEAGATAMTGAEALVQTLVNAGVEVCFTNPGTSEMHMVAAIDKGDGLRPVLTLFEGVATGAADGYARMTGKPACTLLHLGPGLGNGIANLHNARRARVPMVNIVGDHATYHKKYDAPLTSDIEGYARPFSGWLRVSTAAQGLAEDGAAAVQVALSPPAKIATLIVPADCAWGPADGPAGRRPVPGLERVSPAVLKDVAEALGAAERPAILMSGAALRAPGLAAADRLAQACGAKLFCDTFNTRIERGAGRAAITPLPYFGEMAVEALAGVDRLVLVETMAPVAFFAYPGKPGTFVPDACRCHVLAEPGQDSVTALEELADELAPAIQPRLTKRVRPDLPKGALTADAVGRIFAHYLPENAIVSEEGVTGALSATLYSAAAQPHDWLQLTGGAIGDGLPVATGAAIACPDRKVVVLEGDGSAMYTLQALWTQAREGLDVTTILLSNRSYDILKIEFERVGVGTPGPKALDMTELSRPDLDWVKLAEGMGVEGFRADSAEAFADIFSACMAAKGPHLIEAVIPGL